LLNLQRQSHQVRTHFRLSWVLANELAVGTAPLAQRHLDRLEQEGVAGVLSLCSEHEAPLLPGLHKRFVYRRLVLPDHRASRLLELAEVEQALALLAELRQGRAVFVHCLAAMERSPLVCMAWLVSRHGITPQRALDYLMEIHTGTNPLPQQLALLRQLAG
jgi:protein-tyrosine phosphatase